MLTSITLENFKGIGERMIIPIKPLTLIIGANSSGKSSILQAIHLIREILERRNLNPDRTLAGGTSVDLGGFLNLLYNHDPKNKMKLRFDLDLRNTDFPTYDSSKLIDDNDIQGHFSSRVDSAWVEFEISWSKIRGGPLISRYETGLNGQPAAMLETSLDGVDCAARYNIDHPVFIEIPEDSDRPITEEIQWENVRAENLSVEMPVFGECMVLSRPLLDGEYDLTASSLVFTQALTGPGEILRDWLRHFRYLGPLRKTIPRHYQPALTSEESNWADGTAAWDALYQTGQDFINQTSQWMADKDRLGTGYSVRLKQFREIPTDSPLLNELIIAIRNDTFFENYDADYFEQERDRHEVKRRLVIVDEENALELMPHDIGVGVSQLLPVVIGSLISRNSFLAVEQPELHLHPAIQGRLGDLFIESALGERKNILLLETHSEHLILRILRRIRETSENLLPEYTQSVRPEDVQVLYTKQEAQGTRLYSLPITPDGDFAVNWPDGFFDERAEELF